MLCLSFGMLGATLLVLSSYLNSSSLCFLAIGLFLASTMSATDALVNFFVSGSARVLRLFDSTYALLARGSLSYDLSDIKRAMRILAASLALLIGVSLLVRSFSSTLRDWSLSMFPHDLYIRPTPPATPSQPSLLESSAIKRIASIPEVQEVLRSRSVLFQLNGQPTTLTGVELSSRSRPPYTFIHGKLDMHAFLAGEEVLVSESALRRSRLSVGDIIEVADRKVRIAAVYYDYARERGTVLIAWTQFATWVKSNDAESLVVILTSKLDLMSVQDTILSLFPAAAVTVLSTNELRERIDSIFKSTFAVTEVMKAVTALVCVAGLLVALFYQYQARVPEIQALRTLGVRPRELHIAAIIQCCISVVPGLIAGGVGGVIIGWVLVSYVNPITFGWSLHLQLAVYDIIAPVVGVFLLAQLTTLLASSLANLTAKRTRSMDQ
jgi:putative ABC transport system permease protein